MRQFSRRLLGLGLAWITGAAPLVAAEEAPLLSHSEPIGVSEPTLLLGGGDAPRIAASASGFIVVYQSDQAGTLKGRLLDAEGQPMGPPFPVGEEPQAGSTRTVFDGNHFVVTSVASVDEGQELRAQRLSTTGQKVGALERSLLGDFVRGVSTDAVATAGGTLIAACTCEDSADNTCRTWLVTSDAMTEKDELPIAGAAFHLDAEVSGGQLLVSIGFISGGTILVRAGADGLFAEVAPLGLPDARGVPAVARTDEGWAILWMDGTNTRLTLLDLAGELTTDRRARSMRRRRSC